MGKKGIIQKAFVLKNSKLNIIHMDLKRQLI